MLLDDSLAFIQLRRRSDYQTCLMCLCEKCSLWLLRDKLFSEFFGIWTLPLIAIRSCMKLDICVGWCFQNCVLFFVFNFITRVQFVEFISAFILIQSVILLFMMHYTILLGLCIVIIKFKYTVLINVFCPYCRTLYNCISSSFFCKITIMIHQTKPTK